MTPRKPGPCPHWSWISDGETRQCEQCGFVESVPDTKPGPVHEERGGEAVCNGKCSLGLQREPGKVHVSWADPDCPKHGAQALPTLSEVVKDMNQNAQVRGFKPAPQADAGRCAGDGSGCWPENYKCGMSLGSFNVFISCPGHAKRHAAVDGLVAAAQAIRALGIMSWKDQHEPFTKIRAALAEAGELDGEDG